MIKGIQWSSQDLYRLFAGRYGSAKDDFQVLKRLFVVGGKIFYSGEKLYYSRFLATILIVMGFQLIVKGRAKMMRGIDFFHRYTRQLA
ncbi:hypothetical protein Desaci_1905 [Desulfosporosinus acidiphilus SJ4]|uniref:Uncharacterized protein n=1 Tax=Desulfosporosinus acidiphilus (strain DSM 22704 / JCM 16185 / SJ4) TaxID=646529 RepID=I4D508_DESAJ|nr:hypothetical protein [Desulfosporosinus acidiphilus]AFM40882.1 hypothetical protein Desaci_1905 [Desulfosporosinus acidiphilus SJ4]